MFCRHPKSCWKGRGIADVFKAGLWQKRMRKRKFFDAVAIRVRVRSLEAISPK
jgi:hypothetical protein